MANKTLTEKVELEGEAKLVPAIGKLVCAVDSVDKFPFRGRHLVRLAQEAGYEVGDTFKYKIIIECKSS